MRPTVRAVHQAVLHWVVTNVIVMVVQVCRVTDGVLPKSLEPYAAQALSAAGRRTGLLLASNGEIRAREVGFEIRDTYSVIVIARRKRDEHVQVVEQEDDSVQDERMERLAPLDRSPEQRARRIVGEKRGAILRDEGEKESASRTPPSVLRHGGKDSTQSRAVVERAYGARPDESQATETWAEYAHPAN